MRVIRYQTLLFLTLAWASAAQVMAETPAAHSSTRAAYSLGDCFQAALQRSEILADQDEVILQAEEHYRQALAAVFPAVGLSASYQRQQEISGTDPDTYQVKATVTQPLFRGFREFAALRQNQELIAYQEESKAWAGLQLYSDTARGYYAVLAGEADLAHLDDQIKLYEQRIAELSGRVRIGRSRQSEVVSVRAAQAILKAQRRQAQGQAAAAREVLAFLTGLDPEIQLAEPKDIPKRLGSLPTYLDRVEKRPDVLAGRKRVEAVRENIAIAKGGRWPSADLTASAYPVRSGSLKEVRWDAGISLTLPLFTGGAISSRIREAESQLRQAELALQRIRRLDAADIRNAYRLLQASLEQAAALEEASELSRKNYQLILRDYNLGLSDNLDVLQALATDQETRRSLDRVRYAILADYQHLESLAAQIDLSGIPAKENQE